MRFTDFSLSRRILMLLLLVGLLGACDQTGSAPASLKEQLDRLRARTQKYKTLSQRKEDFTQFSGPVPGMGFHFMRKDLAGPSDTYAENWSAPASRKAHRRAPELLVYDTPIQKHPRGSRLVAAEYAVPVAKRSEKPDLFNDEGKDLAVPEKQGWHKHPHIGDLAGGGHSEAQALGACHYKGGPELYLLSDGAVVTVPFGTKAGTWSSPEAGADDCPDALPEASALPDPLKPFAGNAFKVFHGKLWTLHVWVHLDNPKGVFNPTNPNVDLQR